MKKLLLIALLLCSFGAIAQTTSVHLKGTLKSKASDATITSYKWVQVSGPTQVIFSTPNAIETNASGLKLGVYVFEFSATDNFNKTGRDNTTVNVSRDGDAPSVDAGPDQNILLKVLAGVVGAILLGLLVFRKK